MDVDKCLRTEAVFKRMFDLGCGVVRMFQREFAVHPDVHLDGEVIAYLAGAQVVQVGHAIESQDDAFDFLFRFLRQGFFQQFPDTGQR